MTARWFATAIVLGGCAGGAITPNPDASGDVAPPHGYALPEFPGGYAFHTALPPTFSRFLPLSGEEATREPPEAEFYDPASPYFFSYLFVWWLTGTPDLSTTALHDDLVLYYTGLCPSQTVAVTLGDPAPPAGDGGALVARRAGTLEAGTCLGNPVPVAAVETATYDCPDHAAVIVVVSPQPSSSQVRADLVAIRDGFTCW
jgi:hypothetical protein